MHVTNDNHTPEALDYFRLFEAEEDAKAAKAAAETEARDFLTKWRAALRGEDTTEATRIAMHLHAELVSKDAVKWIRCHGSAVIWDD